MYACVYMSHVYIICLYHLGKYIQPLLSHHPFGSCFFPKTTTTAPPITHAHLSICPDTPPLSKWFHLCSLSVTAGWHLSLPWSTENSGSGTHNTSGWHVKGQPHPPCSPGPQLPCSGEAQTKTRGEATCRCPGWQPSWGPSQQLASTPHMGVMLPPDDLGPAVKSPSPWMSPSETPT